MFTFLPSIKCGLHYITTKIKKIASCEKQSQGQIQFSPIFKLFLKGLFRNFNVYDHPFLFLTNAKLTLTHFMILSYYTYTMPLQKYQQMHLFALKLNSKQ